MPANPRSEPGVRRRRPRRIVRPRRHPWAKTLSCDPREYPRRGTCGTYRLYSWGHDGSVLCAYDSSTGALVGGVLYGVPAGSRYCSQTLAGPRDILDCAPPAQTWCADAGAGVGSAGSANDASAADAHAEPDGARADDAGP